MIGNEYKMANTLNKNYVTIVEKSSGSSSELGSLKDGKLIAKKLLSYIKITQV